jgi:hypothetical protein
MHFYYNFIFLHLFFLFLELLVVQLKLLFCRWSLEKTLHECWIKYRGQTYVKIIEQDTSISQTCSCEQSLIKWRYRGDRYNTYVFLSFTGNNKILLILYHQFHILMAVIMKWKRTLNKVLLFWPKFNKIIVCVKYWMTMRSLN